MGACPVQRNRADRTVYDRVLDQLEKSGIKDNTLVIHISGDNGAGGEGTVQGSFNEGTFFNAISEPMALIAKHIGQWGSPYTYPHYPVGWAWAMDTPFQWMKQVASHYGGTRNGLVISWPARIRDVGTMRTQWRHVIDIVPTILEAAGIPQPEIVNGVRRGPLRASAWSTRSMTPKRQAGTPPSILKC